MMSDSIGTRRTSYKFSVSHMLLQVHWPLIDRSSSSRVAPGLPTTWSMPTEVRYGVHRASFDTVFLKERLDHVDRRFRQHPLSYGAYEPEASRW